MGRLMILLPAAASMSAQQQTTTSIARDSAEAWRSSGGDVMRALAVLLLLGGCASSVAPPPREGPPLFALQSNFWLNLHHFLRVVARGEPAPANLTADERAVWDRAVAAYAAKYAKRDLLWDKGMIAIKDTLRTVRAEDALPEIPGEPELKALLESAAPVYRKHWWPAHDTINRAWIAAARPLVGRYGARLSRAVAASYGVEWPSHPLPVDLSISAGPVGAYTTYPPHTTLSPAHGDYHGLASLEMLFHEASHQWGRAIQNAIRTAAESRKKEVPPGLWHAVLFYNTAELTRRVLAEDGIGSYAAYGGEGVYKDLCGAGCRERIAKQWNAYLAGTVPMETALDQLVAEW